MVTIVHHPLLMCYHPSLVFEREKLAVCDEFAKYGYKLTIHFHIIYGNGPPYYGDFVTSLSAYYWCADNRDNAYRAR